MIQIYIGVILLICGSISLSVRLMVENPTFWHYAFMVLIPVGLALFGDGICQLKIKFDRLEKAVEDLNRKQNITTGTLNTHLLSHKRDTHEGAGKNK